MKTNRYRNLAARTPIRQLMSSHFPVLHEKVCVDDAAAFLLAQRTSCAAVSDSDGNLVGSVSMTDLVRDRHLNGDTEDRPSAGDAIERRFGVELYAGFHLEQRGGTTVRDIMTPGLLRLPEGTPVDQAAALMGFEGISVVFVVSARSGGVIGAVTALDVLRWLGDQQGDFQPLERTDGWRRSFEYVT